MLVFASPSFCQQNEESAKSCYFLITSAIVSQNGSNTIIMTGFSTKFALIVVRRDTHFLHLRSCVFNMILPETTHDWVNERQSLHIAAHSWLQQRPFILLWTCSHSTAVLMEAYLLDKHTFSQKGQRVSIIIISTTCLCAVGRMRNETAVSSCCCNQRLIIEYQA